MFHRPGSVSCGQIGGGVARLARRELAKATREVCAPAGRRAPECGPDNSGCRTSGSSSWYASCSRPKEKESGRTRACSNALTPSASSHFTTSRVALPSVHMKCVKPAVQPDFLEWSRLTQMLHKRSAIPQWRSCFSAAWDPDRPISGQPGHSKIPGPLAFAKRHAAHDKPCRAHAGCAEARQQLFVRLKRVWDTGSGIAAHSIGRNSPISVRYRMTE